MSHDCPDCGSAFELEERIAKVRVGTCPSCQRSFTLLPHAANAPSAAAEDGAPVPPEVEVETLDSAPAGAAGSSNDDEEDADTPVCGTCGSDLVFKAADEVTIEVFCPQCDETTRFKAEGAEAPAPRTDDAPERPAREDRPPRDDRPSRDDRPRERRFGGPSNGPPAKGCRRCGGQIDFEPLPDGGREGVCRNCGNRFRLPPRRDDDRGGGGRGYGGGGRGGYGGGGRGYGGGGGYRGGGGGGGRRGPPRYGARPRDDDGDREERPRYRRDRD